MRAEERMQFDPDAFKLEYPEFKDVSSIKLTSLWFEVSSLGAIVIEKFRYDDAKFHWAKVVLAHLTFIDMNGSSGRISQVNEGSVSVQFAPSTIMSQEWWNYSQYGIKCWAILRANSGMTHFGRGRR